MNNEVISVFSPPPSPKPDSYRGYSPAPGVHRSLRNTKDGELVYDVQYAIGHHNYRKTLTSNDSSKECLFFYGGSFTFGEGLNDDVTLPNLIGEKISGKLKCIERTFKLTLKNILLDQGHKYTLALYK